MNHFKDIGIPPYKYNSYYQKFRVKTEDTYANVTIVTWILLKDC